MAMHFQNNQNKSSTLSSTKAPQFPTTSAGIPNTNPFSLFNSQIMPTSSQNAAALQAVANTILHTNPFINPALPMSPVEISQMQHWFQNNISPYASPLASKTPSIISNMSSLSIFANETFNNCQLASKCEKNKRSLKDNKYAIGEFLKIFNNDPDVIDTLRMVITMIVEEKISNDPQMELDIQEIIELIISHIFSQTIRDQRLINSLIEILATVATTGYYKKVIQKRPNHMIGIFIELLSRYANVLYTQSKPQQDKVFYSLLRIIYYALYEVDDKSIAKTVGFFSALLKLLQNGETKTRLFALEILRHLLYRDDEWKKFVANRKGIKLILDLLVDNGSSRFIRQAIRTLNVLVDSQRTEFASDFITLDGIETIVFKAEMSLNPNVFSSALLCLKLVSDRPLLANRNLTKAVCFAVHCTSPSAYEVKGLKIKMYWNNIANALAFLRNGLALNDEARNYLASKDECRAIQHFTTLASLCFDLNLPPNISRINRNFDTSQTKIDPVQMNYLGIIFEHCLAILALINKEDTSGKISDEQKMASQKLCDNENAMIIYQFVLKLDNLDLQKIVLMSLRRSIMAGASIPTDSRQMRIAETLINFLFVPKIDISRLPLMVIASEVLVKLASDTFQRHLSIMTSLFSIETYQPFKLLERFINTSLNIDLCLAILNLMKEMCQRETNLKTLWFHNDNNVQFLKYLMSTSTNPEILHLCSTLHNQIGEENFYDIFTQTMDYENSNDIT